ncbi:MAG: DEAD/DEAH box helicase [Cyclobacteriaceae bacterium]
MTFSEFNFETNLQEGLDAMGFEKPTPIQEQAIPIIMAGKDIIATAQTGTGKTAAFILPILNRITKHPGKGVKALIIAPTRELAIQIDQQIQGLAYFLGVSSIPIYGGGDGNTWEQQKKALEMGAEIVVATPGRLIALLAGGKVNFDSIEHLILDEADRMLDMGFSEDIQTIIQYLPQKRQTLLFSATMPPKIRKFSQKILHEPEQISIELGKTAKGVSQYVYHVYDQQKEDLTTWILNQQDYQAVIIFCSRKDKVKSLYKTLKRNFQVEAFHADLDQSEREKIMSSFKNKSLKILVATDILSRGIDVEDIELVLNFDTPNDPEDYVHRVGRTARAEKKGKAITFVNEKDKFKYKNIQNLIGLEIEVLSNPEEVGKGPDLSASTRQKPNIKSKKSGGREKSSKGTSPKRNHKAGPRAKNTPESHQEREEKIIPKNEPENKSKFRSRKNLND